jgi:hypothetical protein
MDWAGEDLVLDAESAALVIAEFEKHGTDIPIDYHHATLKAETKDGTEAPAAGWVKSLEYVKGEGLYAAVEWNEKAATEIRSKAFKYLSPVFMFRKGTNTPAELHSVALTNRPRTRGMIELLQAAERLAERYQENAEMADNDKGKELEAKIAEAVKAQWDMTVKQLKAGQDDEGGEGLGISPEQKLFIKLAMALGLGDDAQPVDILQAAIDSVGGGEGETEAPEEAEKKAAAKLGCKSLDDAKMKLGAYDKLTERVEAAEKKLAERDQADAQSAAKTLVDEQIDAGKLLPEDEKAVASALKYAERDPEGFTETFKGIPALTPGRLTAVSGPATANEREKVIKAAEKEFAEDPMMRTGKTEIRHFVNTCLRHEGEPELTPVELEKLKGAA